MEKETLSKEGLQELAESRRKAVSDWIAILSESTEPVSTEDEYEDVLTGWRNAGRAIILDKNRKDEWFARYRWVPAGPFGHFSVEYGWIAAGLTTTEKLLTDDDAPGMHIIERTTAFNETEADEKLCAYVLRAQTLSMGAERHLAHCLATFEPALEYYAKEASELGPMLEARIAQDLRKDGAGPMKEYIGNLQVSGMDVLDIINAMKYIDLLDRYASVREAEAAYPKNLDLASQYEALWRYGIVDCDREALEMRMSWLVGQYIEVSPVALSLAVRNGQPLSDDILTSIQPEIDDLRQNRNPLTVDALRSIGTSR